MVFRVLNQPKKAGSETARQQYFGVDKVTPIAPHDLRNHTVQLIERGIEELEQAHKLALKSFDNKVLKDVREDLEKAIFLLKSLRKNLIKRDVDSPFRVVLMGRTMAGKSTLFELLTGGDGKSIGVGRQRTTRETNTRPLVTVPGAEIVDTPGVGAMDGEDDYHKAFSEVDDADLIIWVAPDQSTQEETGRALRELAHRGKPILVALNCLADLSKETNLYDLLEEPQYIFNDNALGNLAPIRRYLATEGTKYLDAIPVHAQAAQLARMGYFSTTETEKILRNSQISKLIDAIEKQRADTAHVRRLVSIADSAITGVEDVLNMVGITSQEMEILLQVLNGSSKAFKRRADRRIEDAYIEIQSVLAASVTKRERWAEQINIRSSEKFLNEKWKLELEELQAELISNSIDITNRLSKDLKNIAVEVADDWTEFSTDDFWNVGGANAIWGNRAVKVTGRVAGSLGGIWAGTKIGALIGASVGGPPGAAIGGFIGAIVVPALVGIFGTRPLDWAADKIFGDTKHIYQRRRERIHKQLAPLLSAVMEQGEEACDALRKKWSQAVDTEIAHQREISDLCSQTLQYLSDFSNRELVPILESIDRELARSILKSTGRSRSADSLIKATRGRNAGFVIELPPLTFSETVLFPMPDSVELFIPVNTDASSSATSLQVIRTLSDDALDVQVMSKDELVISLATPITEGSREAWESLAQNHSGVKTKVLQPR